jgi:hypothetical protein
MTLERTHEAEILTAYEKYLDEAFVRLSDAQHEVDSLRAVVQSLRSRLAGGAQEPTRFPSVDGLPTYRGRPSLREYLRRLVAQEARIALEQLVATVQADPHYSANPPSRNTILSRANDLVRRGVFIKPTETEYALSPNGSEPAPGGTNLGPEF